MVELSRKLTRRENDLRDHGEIEETYHARPSNNTEKKDKSGVRTAGAISFVFLLTLFAKLLGVCAK